MSRDGNYMLRDICWWWTVWAPAIPGGGGWKRESRCLVLVSAAESTFAKKPRVRWFFLLGGYSTSFPTYSMNAIGNSRPQLIVMGEDGAGRVGDRVGSWMAVRPCNFHGVVSVVFPLRLWP